VVLGRCGMKGLLILEVEATGRLEVETIGEDSLCEESPPAGDEETTACLSFCRPPARRTGCVAATKGEPRAGEEAAATVDGRADDFEAEGGTGGGGIFAEERDRLSMPALAKAEEVEAVG
jgi:hypothetical protein